MYTSNLMTHVLPDEPYMLTIKADDTVSSQHLDKIPDLEQLKAGLDGGRLEVVPQFTRFAGKPCVAFCDEEGKLKNLPFNPTAHILWEAAAGHTIRNDNLVGPIVIIVGAQGFLAGL